MPDVHRIHTLQRIICLDHRVTGAALYVPGGDAQTLSPARSGSYPSIINRRQKWLSIPRRARFFSGYLDHASTEDFSLINLRRHGTGAQICRLLSIED